MRSVSLFCLCMIHATALLAQQEEFNTALELAEQNYLVDNDSLLFYAEKAIKLGVENEYPRTSEAYNHKAFALFYQARYHEGIEIVRTGLAWVAAHNQENTPIEADLYNRQGGNYILLGFYELGLEQLLKARSIYRELGDQDKLITILNNIGVVWLKLNDYNNALATYTELESYAPTDPNILVPLNYNFANIYHDIGQYEKALGYAEESLNVLPDGDQRASQIYYMLGNIQAALGDLETANQSYLTSIELYTEQSNELNTVQPKLGLARLFIQQGDLDAALAQATESLQIALRGESLPDRVEALGVLSTIAEEQGNLELALSYYKSYTEFSDSLKSISVNQEIANLIAENEYEHERHELLIAQQEEQLQASSQLTRQRIVIGAAFLLILLVLTLLIFQRRTAIERKKNNELLIRKNQIIEEKAQKLDESNSVKNRLFSIIAHDLRNPLSSLQGVIELLEMKAASKKDLDRILPYVANKFENTSILLTNLLEWSMSQMEGYQIVPESFDLGKLAREKFGIIEAKAREKELRVYLSPEPIMVFADKSMMGIVVLNMLSNCVKFTGHQGTIRLESSKKEGNMLISISDSGTGIPEERLPRILDDGFYSTEGTGGEKGTGLGLTICKEFVQKNNGSIWIESEKGKGTTVSFTLPLAEYGVHELSMN